MEKNEKLNGLMFVAFAIAILMIGSIIAQNGSLTSNKSNDKDTETNPNNGSDDSTEIRDTEKDKDYKV